MLWLSCECGTRVKVPENRMGGRYTCVRCGRRFKVTDKNTTEVTADTPKGNFSGPIGEALVHAGIIRQAQLDEALRYQAEKGGKLAENLIALGYLDARTFVNFLNTQFPPSETKPRIGELLVAAEVVSQQQLDEAMALQRRQGGRVVEKLIDLGYLDTTTFVRFLSVRTEPERFKPRIGELLVSEQLVTPAELGEALEMQAKEGGKVVENLIALGYLDAQRFLGFVSRQPGVASISLLNYDIEPEVVQLVPKEYALKHELMPVDRMGGTLTVGMACPLDAGAIKELEGSTGLRVRPLLVSMSDIRAAINRHYPSAPTAVTAVDTEDRPGADKPQSPAPWPVSPDRVSDWIANQRGLYVPAPSLRLARELILAGAACTDRVTELFAGDPVLTALIIGRVNQSGHKEAVRNVGDAVAVAGLHACEEALGLAGGAEGVHKAFLDTQREHARFCAHAAERLALASGAVDDREAFAVGMMHDLGRLALAELAPEQYVPFEHPADAETLLEGEQVAFGVTHADAGRALALAWGLPPDHAEALRHHHVLTGDTSRSRLGAVVALASGLTDCHGDLSGHLLLEFCAAAEVPMRLLGLRDVQVIGALDATLRAMGGRPEV